MKKAFTLVEVMVAGAILLAGLVPLIALVTTGSTQAVKARDRALAGHLATAVIEEQWARPARADVPPTAAGALAMFVPLIDAHKNDPARPLAPADAAALDRVLANFTVRLTVGGPAPAPVRVSVDWQESGEPRQLVRDSVLGVP